MPENIAAEVEEFLGSPAAYGLSPDMSVARIETHISIVFLAGDFAFKLKKRLNLSYLDFSTLEARHAACAQELSLNRRTAPTLYVDVLPITKTANGLVLGQVEGEIVDWLVQMKRFDQSHLLSKMADRDALPVSLMDVLARKVERFHCNAEVCKSAGGRTRFADILESNQKNFRPFVGDIYSRQLLDDLATRHTEELGELSHMIDARRAAGWVRHCHGDLHLNNVVCLDGAPVPFDCIEFNDDFARIDTLYDLAFLLMDLAFRAKREKYLFPHANVALNAYLHQQSLRDLTETIQGLRALPFFMSVRAAVRSHVSARMADATGAEKDGLRALALSYAGFALELLNPTEPILFAIGGLSGTGKTTMARLLAPDLGHPIGAVHLRTDIIRKRQAGVRDTDRLPASAYTQKASDNVYAEMAQLAGLALDAGLSVICDAVFAKPAERKCMEDVANARERRFSGVWLNSPAKELEARVEKRSLAGDDASDAGPGVVRQQLSYDLGDIGWVSVETGGSPEAVAERAHAALNLT